MTLIVGIKCTDGIVVGADGAATISSMGQETIRQPTKKLEVRSGKVIIGVSGPVGLGQRIMAEVEDLWDKNAFKDMRSVQAMVTIRNAIWPHVRSELEASGVVARLLGPKVALGSSVCQTVTAMPVSVNHCLFQFDQQCAPEEATDQLPFLAVGSGQAIADPFLTFIRRIFWLTRPPTLAEGTFAALWTLSHAIQTAPGYITGPEQIIVLRKDKKNWQARELERGDLEEHRQGMKEAENALSNYSKGFLPTSELSTPEPPMPEK